jgi:hypothetical protein
MTQLLPVGVVGISNQKADEVVLVNNSVFLCGGRGKLVH